MQIQMKIKVTYVLINIQNQFYIYLYPKLRGKIVKLLEEREGGNFMILDWVSIFLYGAQNYQGTEPAQTN